MSKETEKGKGTSDNLCDNPGFRTALLINVPHYNNGENGLKEVTEGLEGLKMNSSDFFVTPTITPRQSDTYKNFISSDLLKRLEESSPIKSQKSTDFRRKPSDICLQNCDKEEGESEMVSRLSKEMKLNRISEEAKENEKTSDSTKSNDMNLNENVISNMTTNFMTRNFKLKTQVLNHKVEINEEENQEHFDNGNKRISNQSMNITEEPQSFFSSSMNFANLGGMNSQTNYYSPPYTQKQTKHSRKESPILSYYDGTSEYISQNLFFDEFKKNNEKVMSKNNFIKKVEEAPVEEESMSLSMNSPMRSVQSSRSSSNFHSSKFTDDQSSFNSFQLPFNFFNNGGGNPNFININQLNQNFNQQANPFARGRNERQEFFDQDSSSSHENFNLMGLNNNPHQVNLSMAGNGNPSYIPLKRNNLKNITAPNYPHTQLDSVDEFTVEMFGRKGWICEMCNNFNYETRQKCNRCGINKSPKKIKKHSQNLRGNQDSMKLNLESETGDDLDDSAEKKKKKPFVERVGDWVCIKCKNLNFSFRVVCNRCQLPKSESDKMFEHYMSNLMNYVKFNEMMQQNIVMGQNQMPMQQSMHQQSMQQSNMQQPNMQQPNMQQPNMQQQQPNFNPSGYINNNSININNNFYNNYNQNKGNANFGGGYGKPNYTANGNLNNGISFNASSSMSMSNVSNAGNMSNMGNQFQLGNMGEDEYYDDEN